MSDEELDRVIEESRERTRSLSDFSRVPAEELDSESEAMAPMAWGPSAATELGSMADGDLERPIRRISNEEFDRILAESRKEMQKHEDYWRVQRDAPAGLSETMPPMVSIPDLHPRENRLPERRGPCSEQTSPAPAARPQRAALRVGAQIATIVLRATGGLWLAVIFAAVAWDVVEHVRDASSVWAAIEWIQEEWSPRNIRHFLSMAALVLPGIVCLELAKRVPRAR